MKNTLTAIQKKSLKIKRRRAMPLYLMLLPAVVILFIYRYIPMFGVAIAFQKYKPAKGFFKSSWIGLDNFQRLFSQPSFSNAFWNTLIIAVAKLILDLIIPFAFALLLNELRNKHIKKSVQTIVYLPHFISWVLLSGIFIEILSPTGGIVNTFLGQFGIEPIFFLGDNSWFRKVILGTHVYKSFGWGTIIYLAAITGISPPLYEASLIDGANRWQQMLHITIPGIMSTVILLATLSLGKVLNAGFDQIYNMLSPITYESGDIIDTLVYRIGIDGGNFSLATAAGLFKSAISFVLIVASYKAADRFAGYKIF